MRWPVPLVAVAALALIAPRWLPDKKEAERSRISIYRVAPGKQLEFLQWQAARDEAFKEAGIAVSKELAFFGARDYYRTSYGTPISNQKVSVYIELQNRQADGLGLPLPKGKVRVYKADQGGSQQFIGEDWIDHTPKDEKVRIKMGEAFDVVGERVQKDWRKIGSGLYEVEWEISLRNHKKEPVTISVIEPLPGDWEVLRSSATRAISTRIPAASSGRTGRGATARDFRSATYGRSTTSRRWRPPALPRSC